MRFSIGLALALVATVSAGDERVWIFAGLPGDEEHHAEFEKTLGSLEKSFVNRLGVKPENLAIYYGPRDAGFAGVASRENVLAAIRSIAGLTRTSPATPHWLIFMGHAHAIRGGAQLNLPGADLNSMDLAAALDECAGGAPLTLVFTHTASAPFLRPLAAPGRVLITATAPRDIENETEFPAALAESLADGKTDANKDGRIDAAEIFISTREAVLLRYKAEDLIVRESALLDGDADGRGTQRPADPDREGARTRFFTLSTTAGGIE